MEDAPKKFVFGEFCRVLPPANRGQAGAISFNPWQSAKPWWNLRTEQAMRDGDSKGRRRRV
jgi:hypothetical protein